jgi:nucleotide-binding universal stress UspA family protein
MYVDATNAGILDRRAEAELVQTITVELQSFEHRVKRIQVRVRAFEGRHVCHLLAWSERGHTISVERRGQTTAAAALVAVRSLTRALMRPPVATVSGSAMAMARVPSRRSGAGRGRNRAVPARHPAAASSSPREGRVLLALHELECSSANVHWARLLAAALEAPLDVCRAVAGAQPPAALSPGARWLSTTRRSLTEIRSTRAWCRESLPNAQFVARLVPAEEGYVGEMARLVRERNSDWVVVPADGIASGPTVVELARRARCPVLVARPPKTRCTLLVVSDGDADNRDSLARAARLAQAFHAPVLAFHNVHASASAPFVPLVDALTRPWQRIQAQAAAARPEYHLPELDVLLGYGRDRVATIFQQARREDADMIIVGVGAAPGSSAGTPDDVVAGVVERAARSVLVVPDSSSSEIASSVS